MEKIITLFILVSGLALCPGMYFFLQEAPKKKKCRPMWRFSIVGAVIALFLELLIVRSVDIVTMVTFGASGALFAQLLVLFSEIAKRVSRQAISPYYNDGRPPRFYITGDKHRDFSGVERFCREVKTRKKDVLIILGDAGFNYYDDKRDDELKERASCMNITLFCLHGNKENRPENVGTYGKRSFYGGKVYYEPKYPNILFAIDGEVYNFDGREYFVMGGAHSVDKKLCLEEGRPYWTDEMPSPVMMKEAEATLAERGNKIYGVLTHTCPFRYLPTEMFVSTRQNAKLKRKSKPLFKKKTFEPDIDRTTEHWLEKVEQKLDYEVWFCGHYHVDKPIDRVIMMYRNIRPLYFKEEDL